MTLETTWSQEVRCGAALPAQTNWHTCIPSSLNGIFRRREPLKVIGGAQRVCKVSCDGTAFVLKDISDAPNLLRLAFTRDVLAHVARSGLRVPVPLLSRSAQLAMSWEGRLYSLSEFIEAGDYPSEPELQPELFFQIGCAIARLHEALAIYPEADARSRTWREDLVGQVAEWISSLSAGLPEHQAAVVQRVEGARGASIARALRELPEQLIHRDCHPGNILVEGTRVVGFIDCDHLCIGPRVFDLAYYAVHHLKWVTDDAAATGRWLANLPHLLTGYCSMERLSLAEMSALPHAMMAYHLMLAAWLGGRAQPEPIALEVQALDWIDRHFDAIVAATTSASERS